MQKNKGRARIIAACIIAFLTVASNIVILVFFHDSDRHSLSMGNEQMREEDGSRDQNEDETPTPTLIADDNPNEEPTPTTEPTKEPTPPPAVSPADTPTPSPTQGAEPAPSATPTPSPTPTPPVQIVWQDAALEQAIREITGISEGIVTSADIADISELDLENRGIRDISALSCFTGLTRLYLSNNNISDIRALESLTRLKWLRLSDNRISDVTPLRNLNKLTVLRLENNNIMDITPLGGLTSLRKLYLEGNHITDFSPIEGIEFEELVTEAIAEATPVPVATPTKAPTKAPTKVPTKAPTKVPTKAPTKAPTKTPTKAPTKAPTKTPTKAPTKAPASQILKSVANIKKAKVGNTVKFGSFEQDNDKTNGFEDLEWIILEKNENKALLLAKKGLEVKAFDDKSDSTVTWADCSLRKWMNDKLYASIFSVEEKKYVLSTTLSTASNVTYRTSGGKKTKDKLFILSLEELRKYYNKAIDKEDSRRTVYLTKYAFAHGGKTYITDGQYKDRGYWWLRNMGQDGQYACYVSYDGTISTSGAAVFSTEYAVRPAVWITFNP